ncbi:MAG TPA: hypothetical protein VGS57_01440 [Thermoanaerobaculia bacterium]|nr:hypothetical protein [Thermoanaerobaculia bacterium]
MRDTDWKSRPWGSKSDFNRLSGILATAEREDFQVRVLPLLRAMWPAAIGTPSSRSFDRSGIDHLVWGNSDTLALVVQTKGFQAGTLHLGSDQIRACRDSIRSFAASGLRTAHYVLVHNRDARDARFRTQVQAELEELERQRVAVRAELWDRQSLLRAAFDAMYDRIRDAIRNSGRNRLPRKADTGLPTAAPLEGVPVQTSLLVVDQHHLRGATVDPPGHRDPVELLLKHAASNLTVLLGSFGMGKTTAVERLMDGSALSVIYVPAARISGDVSGAKQFLTLCVDLDELLSPFPAEDWPVLEQLLPPPIEYLFKDQNADVILILDGLDESAFLARAGGLQTLFNMLQPIQIPVVLTMRTEFWDRRRGEFEYPMGMEARHGERRHRRVALIELLPWKDADILSLVERIRSDAAPQQADRLAALLDLIQTEQFDRIYGDIPRRPLFLQQIIDSVSEHGLPGQTVSRVSLMTDWVRDKVRRDVLAPRAIGGSGRAPVVEADEETETVVETCWTAMTVAAAAMTMVQEGHLLLLPDCGVDEIHRHLPYLRREPLGLLLHSLLQPVAQHGSSRPLRVQFAHRSFQEFFLAQSLISRPNVVRGLTIPEAIEAWIREIKEAQRDSDLSTSHNGSAMKR